MEVTGNEFENAPARIYPSIKQPLISSEKKSILNCDFKLNLKKIKFKDQNICGLINPKNVS